MEVASWCQCGYCPVVCDENQAVGTDPVCCKDVVYGIGRGSEGEVCMRVDIVGLITLGPTTEQYEVEKKRLTEVKPLIDTYNGCNAAQKRLILYGVLHKVLPVLSFQLPHTQLFQRRQEIQCHARWTESFAGDVRVMSQCSLFAGYLRVISAWAICWLFAGDLRVIYG